MTATHDLHWSSQPIWRSWWLSSSAQKQYKGCVAVFWLTSISNAKELKGATFAVTDSLQTKGVLQVFIGEELILDLQFDQGKCEHVVPPLHYIVLHECAIGSMNNNYEYDIMINNWCMHKVAKFLAMDVEKSMLFCIYVLHVQCTYLVNLTFTSRVNIPREIREMLREVREAFRGRIFASRIRIRIYHEIAISSRSLRPHLREDSRLCFFPCTQG